MAKLVMAVDFGDARTGLAVSDSTGFLASRAGCVKCAGLSKTVDEVAAIAAERGVELIIVGDPINMDGSEGPRCQRCRRFADELREKTGLEVQMLDERLTTVLSYRLMNESGVFGKKRRDSVDEMSAVQLLQDYLDSHKGEL